MPAVNVFGTTLIKRSLAYEIQGQTSLLFESDGLRCDMHFPLGEGIRRRHGH
ncbi:hypothetical protein [Niveispirillum lacus]|uniref:hypothetical protein n=1 Tax=Niveispirillum lacus TaxID=1981099 RepID=UPI0013FE2B19|nr:hypothetical protein [Niveispirillum lacus]